MPDQGGIRVPTRHKELRDELGIVTGTEVEFARDGEVIVVPKAAGSHRGRRLAERLRGRGDVALSTDEIMALTRG